ncbi:MAG: hypothetical protein AABZ30_06685 [Myxococcota bacterium]
MNLVRALFVCICAGCALEPIAALPRGGAPDAGARESGAVEAFVQSGRRVDLLLVVDDSSGMAEEQSRFAAALPRLVAVLDAAGTDWRAGIVTTDLGTGPYDWEGKGGADGCEAGGGGDQALLQGDPAVLSHGSVGDPAAELAARVDLAGEDGCGFERPLDAAVRAVSPELAGADGGLVRDDALLSIVFLTDEDDCSADEEFYSPDNPGLGPPTSFRCFFGGVACDDEGDDGAWLGCRAQSVQPLVRAIPDVLAALAERKGSLVTASLVGGALAPVRVGIDELGFPEVVPSCAGSDARPPIRLAAVVDQLGGVRASLCEADLRPALEAIGADALERLRAYCLRRPLADTASPDCGVVEVREGGQALAIPRRAQGTPGWWFARPVRLACENGAIVFDEEVVPRAGSRVEMTCDFAD